MRKRFGWISEWTCLIVDDVSTKGTVDTCLCGLVIYSNYLRKLQYWVYILGSWNSYLLLSFTCMCDYLF